MNSEKLNPFFSRIAVENVPMISRDQDCLPLCWADPLFPASDMPEPVKQACLAALKDVGAHYTLPTGLPELKRAAADKIRRETGMVIDPEQELFIVPGADAGLYYAMLPFLTPGSGEEVLVPSPSYINNFVNPGLMGAVAVPVWCDPEKGYALERKNLEVAVTDKTRMVVLTNPNNPTGRCYTREELSMLADFVNEHDLIAVVDQAFEDTVFTGYSMVILSSLPGMRERTVTVYSLSKGYGLCGLRIGYITAPAQYMGAMQKYAVNVLGAPNTIAQYGALAALSDETLCRDFAGFFERRTLKTWEILSVVPGVHICKPQAGFYLWADVSALGDGAAVAEYCAERAHVRISAGDAFGYSGEKHIRIITAAISNDELYYQSIYRVRDALLELQNRAERW